MIAAVRSVAGHMPAGEFLSFLRSRPKEERWQLVEGTAIMMNPPTLVHQTRGLIAQKLRRYTAHPDNLYCLVIDSRRTWAQIHARARGWEPATLDGPADALELPELALRRTVGDLYRGTPLDPRRPAGRGRPRSR